MFSEAEREIIFDAARGSIIAAVSGARQEIRKTLPAPLRHPSGAFVTLRADGELRGCIGYVDAVKSLYETVREAAAKAATEDFRFDPVCANEIPGLAIEISVLSPLRRITDIGEIEVGKHGLVVELGNCRGLLLPQVAVEHGWDREMFIMQATRKAGLPASMWRHPDARVHIFTAEVIHQDAPTHHEGFA